jgi:hypothetical protein
MLDLDNITKFKNNIREILSRQEEYNLQELLEFIYENYSKRGKLDIKFNKIVVKCLLTKEKLPDGRQYYYLRSEEELSILNDVMYSMEIKFYSFDIFTGKVDLNAAYISNVHKNFMLGFVSGAYIMKLINTLFDILHVPSAYLVDAAVVKCDLDNKMMYLSLFKTLEKNRTFYQAYGYNPTLSPSLYPDYFSTKEQYDTVLKNKKKTILNWKVGDLYKQYMKLYKIIVKIIRDIGYKYVEIDCYHNTTKNIISDDYELYMLEGVNLSDLLLEYLKSVTKVLKILEPNKNKNFAKWITSSDCNLYNIVIDFLFGEQDHILYKIKYKKFTYSDEIMPICQQLKRLLQYSYYRRTLKY